MKPKLDGYWEEGYHYYLEIKGRRATLRDYAKRVIFTTSLTYDKAAVARGESAKLTLGETVLSRAADGDPMTWIKDLRFEDGRIIMDYYYTIMGDTRYTLNRVDHGPFDDTVIRDREILPRIQGLWLEWSRNGIDEKEYGLRIKGRVLCYGSKGSDLFKVKIHAVSRKNDPGTVLLTPEDLTVREFPGMTQITVGEKMLTSRMIICDVSTPLSVFVRREDYDSIPIPGEALEEPRNLMMTDAPPLMTDEAPPVEEPPVGEPPVEAPGKSRITVISKTAPNTCGGTDATRDEDAPKTITSDKMTLFDVTSALPRSVGEITNAAEDVSYVSAFAAPAGNGSFMFLETRELPFRRDPGKKAWALLSEDVFPKLVELVRRYDLAADNGFHSKTHGLPENFGGDINIEYESGERISVSDNQSPVLGREAGIAIIELFENALRGSAVPLPDVGSLRSIRFAEEREDGGFTRAVLTVNGDGTGTNDKEQKFNDPDVFKSTKAVSAETVAAIKSTIAENGMLAWAGLPQKRFSFGGVKTLTFVFDDGTELTVKGDRDLPSQLGGAFFNIELEMTTKH